MSQLLSIVEDFDAACKSEHPEHDACETEPPRSVSIERAIHEQVRGILEFLKKPDPSRSFDSVERGLVPLVFALGRLFLAFFLAWRGEHSHWEVRAWARRGFRRRRVQPRLLGTFFGKVRYWRSYMTEESGSGLYPLDLALGLSADGFSLLVLDMAARLATLVSFDQVTTILKLFLGWSPSKTSVEKMVLGLGKRTGDWFREASYTSKRHAFEVARREADKRGFPKGSGKLVQLVTDGDEDLRDLGKEFFPDAIHTLDVMHAMEYLWEAGACLFREGSKEQAAWVKKVENHPYKGKVFSVLGEITAALEGIPKTGPGNKGRRQRLETALNYLYNRTEMMNYASLKAQDLELSSGSVEGAVKHVIAKRFDNGSMRWIRERAEALLQLRCIEINGDWNAFIQYVHEKTHAEAVSRAEPQVILSLTPAPLPERAKIA